MSQSEVAASLTKIISIRWKGSIYFTRGLKFSNSTHVTGMKTSNAGILGVCKLEVVMNMGTAFWP